MNLEPATDTDASWVAGVLQASDTFYPTGSYAHSFGLEGLVAENVVLGRESLREVIWQVVLPNLAHVEIPLALCSYDSLHQRDWEKVGEILHLSAAGRVPRESRGASEKIGRQRCELLAMLRPNSLAPEFVQRAEEADWPFAAAVAVALEALVHGAPRASIPASVSYAALAALVAAAMKLLRLGQNAAQALLTEALGEISRLAAVAGKLTLEEIGWSNPWLDIASARHEVANARMFIS